MISNYLFKGLKKLSIGNLVVFDYEYLREFEAKIGTARNVVQGTYAEPVHAKTPENPPHCHVPLNVPPRELFSTILFVDDHLIFVATFSNIFKNSTSSVFCLYRLFFSFFLDFRVKVLFSLL